MRRGAAAAACLVAAATGAATLSSCASDTKDQAKATASVPIRQGDMLVVGLDRSRPRTYGNAAVVPAADPSATRRLTALKCKRVAYAAGTGICLAERLPAKAVPAFQATFFDARQHVTGSVDVAGDPSRARVSPGGRYAAATTFVGGDSYAPEGRFSTRTVIFDAQKPRMLANIEDFAVFKDGRRIRDRDFNFWGVTFDGDAGRFYATLATGTHHYLVRGDLGSRRVTVLRDGVECPSLSPDRSRIAFKARVGKPWQWRFHILDLKTGKITALPEERSVDDQIEWLDEQRLVYDRDEVVMQVAADGKSPPQEFLPSANSPALVR
jgi:hypothetical protein